MVVSAANPALSKLQTFQPGGVGQNTAIQANPALSKLHNFQTGGVGQNTAIQSNPGLSKLQTFQPEVGQNTAIQASPITKNFTKDLAFAVSFDRICQSDFHL